MAITTSSLSGDDRLRRDRKYRVFWAAFLTATVALAWNKLSGDQWVTFCSTVFGLYMAGNVGEHAADAYREKGKGGNGEVVDPEKA